MRLLFILASFLSATLLFLVQPMVAKMILPLAGGTPAVWATCMVFFQAALLAGYAYAHLSTSQLGPRRSAAVHPWLLVLPIALMALAATRLGAPLTPIKSLAPGDTDYPIFPLLSLLVALVGVPFLFVATSAPLLQRWFADTTDVAARDPYFLYAASNLGSFLGLILYPAYIERYFTLQQQAWIWAGGFLVWAFLIGWCAQSLRTSPVTLHGMIGSRKVADSADRDSWVTRLRWVALAAVPSSLMLSVTTFATTDLAPIPLFFVVPLGIYLLTFVVAFSIRANWVFRVNALIFPMILLVVLFLRLSGSENGLVEALRARYQPGESRSTEYIWKIGYHVLVFAILALGCHLELARSRPPARRLTQFYLWISFGGMLGGLFNALLAPMIFKELTEYAIGIVAACFVVPPVSDGKAKSPLQWLLDLLIPAALGVATLIVLKYYEWAGSHWPMQNLNNWFDEHKVGFWTDRIRTIVCFGVPALVCFIFVERPIRFGLGAAAIFAAVTLIHAQQTHKPLLLARSFFGTLKVDESEPADITYHRLEHGWILHGMQAWEPFSGEPLTYYHKTGPVGDIFAQTPAGQSNSPIGFVGLGSGSISAYVKEKQHATFYEIDTVVRRIAEDPTLFRYVTDARSRGTVDIVMGDARLKIEEAPPHEYAVIAVDAFSSDSIPVHLLTKEAVQLYMAKLKPDGILALHVSNRYLELDRVVARIADELKLPAYDWYDNDETAPGKNRSHWIVLVNDAKNLGDMAFIPGKEGSPRWKPLKVNADNPAPLWTDDFSNVLSVFSW